jgi:hypothetical protein
MSDIIVTHDKHVRKLLKFRSANTTAKRFVGFDHIGTESASPKTGNQKAGVGIVIVTHRQDARLHWSEPCGECTGIVLNQNTEESFY